MPNRAPRRPGRMWYAGARGARLALGLWLAATAGWACAPDHGPLPGRATTVDFSNRTVSDRHEDWAPRDATLTMRAGFAAETDEYGHGILGPIRDAKTLIVEVFATWPDNTPCPATTNLPAGQVFEDIAPRLADIDGDGRPEIVVVRSSTADGARLEIYDRHARLVAATPAIGRRNRWLAPAGIGDLDGDGRVEIAYVDRPHLARILRIWRFDNGGLTEIASLPGLSNHRIGEPFISGGLRDCGAGPELVLASADWARIVAISYDNGWSRTDLGPFTGPDSLLAALRC